MEGIGPSEDHPPPICSVPAYTATETPGGGHVWLEEALQILAPR